MNKYWAEYDKYFISLQAVFAPGRERTGPYADHPAPQRGSARRSASLRPATTP